MFDEENEPFYWLLVKKINFFAWFEVEKDLEPDSKS